MRWIAWALGLSVAMAAAGVRADAPGSEGYALVVGANVGGPGQGPLRYAEQDAGRVAEVLHTLGGYPAARIERLVQPTAAELRAALDRVRERIEPLADGGRRARFFFYYSGHARADGLNLGSDQLPLTELRERIEALPATLSIVVLDACQSGAYSRVKGADKAADFSWNSRERLNSEGVAVIASSSAKELSQESEELRSGYFTHHWLVALRGAGDRDADGRVTLSEAYQYTYNHTLATTAQTAVGEQHPTLETNIRGKDDVALTHPAEATTRLRIPTSFAGRVLIQRLPSWSVWAEMDKAPSAPVLLALPAGDYAITLRQGSRATRCGVTLREGVESVLDPDRCAEPVEPAASVKGRGSAVGAPAWDPNAVETWSAEVAFGAGGGHDDTDYVRRVRDFGFAQDEGVLDTEPRFIINLQRRFHPNLALGVSYYNLQSSEYERYIEIGQTFEWNAHAVGLYLHGDVAFGRARFVSLFGRLGLGMSIAWTTLDAIDPLGDLGDLDPAFQDTTLETREVTQRYFRPSGFLAGGVNFAPWRHFGFHLELRYAVAPAIDNEIGDTHDVGGVAMLFGIHLRLWE